MFITLFSQLDGEKQLRKKAEGKCVGYESDVANLKKKLESSKRNENELLASVTHLEQLNKQSISDKNEVEASLEKEKKTNIELTNQLKQLTDKRSEIENALSIKNDEFVVLDQKFSLLQQDHQNLAR